MWTCPSALPSVLNAAVLELGGAVLWGPGLCAKTDCKKVQRYNFMIRLLFGTRRWGFLSLKVFWYLSWSDLNMCSLFHISYEMKYEIHFIFHFRVQIKLQLKRSPLPVVQWRESRSPNKTLNLTKTKSKTLGYSISRKSSADRGNASAQATNKMQQRKKTDKAGFTRHRNLIPDASCQLVTEKIFQSLPSACHITRVQFLELPRSLHQLLASLYDSDSFVKCRAPF